MDNDMEAGSLEYLHRPRLYEQSRAKYGEVFG